MHRKRVLYANTRSRTFMQSWRATTAHTLLFYARVFGTPQNCALTYSNSTVPPPLPACAPAVQALGCGQGEHGHSCESLRRARYASQLGLHM